MTPNLQIEFGHLNAETILLSIALLAVIFLAFIRYMIRCMMSDQTEKLEAFKIDLAQMIGKTMTEIANIRTQAELSSRALEKRIEAIERNIINRDDYARENTLLHAAYGDLQRYISQVSHQLEILKALINKEK